MTPALRAILLSQPGTVSALFKKMVSPTRPLPAFVEGWAMSSFHGQDYNVPSGYLNLPTDSEGLHILNMTVSGTAGASQVTGTGFDTTNGTGSWSCSILHDDGTYGIYTASGITSTTLNIIPPLRATVTSKNLASVGGLANDQHYGQQAYKALAHRIFNITNQDGYRNGYASAWRAATDDKTAWGLIGISPSGVSAVTANSYGPLSGITSAYTRRGTRVLAFGPYSSAGLGVSHTASLGGRSGYLETFVSPAVAAGAVNVKVTIDGTVTYNQNISGLTRVMVPYTNANTGLLQVTTATASSTSPAIGDTTWWVYDRTGVTWTNNVIGVNDKVVFLGDSWSQRYSSVLGTELAAAQTAAGGTIGSVTTVGLSGQTAEWGLSVFDAQVAPLSPNVVVIEFFTNDHNSFGLGGSDRWLTALYKIGLKCQAIGARPVFLMPLPTQSISQTQEHGIWTERIGLGMPI